MKAEDLPHQQYDFEYQGENTFSFKTLNEIIYLVKFRPTPYLFGEDSIFAPYSFELIIEVAENLTGRNPVFDTRVSRTVAAVFEEFYLNSEQNITIYICESADKRQDIRKTKFNRWFEHFAPLDYNKYDAAFKDTAGNIYPVSLILKDKNPNRAVIITAFINIISGYNAGK